MSVKVVEVQKTYKLGENQVQALRGVNLELQKGEFVAFTGPSGSGKTTLLNLIGVLDKPTQGKIYVDGIDLTLLKEKDLTKLRRSTIGFIFQFYNLIPVLSAIENVELPMLIAGVTSKERENRAKELLKMVGLADRIHHRPDELSGGEQQRVAIVRALANKPSIVLADEPTGDLDSKTGKEVVNALRDLSNHEGATVIIVTHDPSVASMTSKVFEMRDGMIIAEKMNKPTPQLKGTMEKVVPTEKIADLESKTDLPASLSSEPNLPEQPINQFSIQKIMGLLVPTDTVRIDSEAIKRWNNLYSGKQITMVNIEALDGKKTTCKFKAIKETKYNAKGIIQIPEKILQTLQTEKGKLVMVEPVIE
jgi:putative ABC transport system ATP-binding protein